MKPIEATVQKVDVSFMPFFGKVLKIENEQFTVSYWGGDGDHGRQKFILKNIKLSDSGLKEGDIIFIAQDRILIFENDKELREGLSHFVNRDFPKEHIAGNKMHIEEKMEELKAAK